MVRVYADGEYGCGGTDGEDVGKMPDRVGIFVPLCSEPTIRKRKNSKKEKKSDRGGGKYVGIMKGSSELGGRYKYY